ncbi:protein kinase [Anabaena sp. UHCC 0187]|uniref:serine/threonine-protein kinase n=1 Tax=Anabaena sp. UHCC 0187 TaxID=2590018 RepID=UPI001444BB8E|nr:serine/threonine-protein kinase [Anabaena sp. UHCC 0187]MTJ12004.1 protein kinase [Anabaena sp. UHCC 0187]
MKLWQPHQYLNNDRFIIQNILGSGGFGVTYSVKELSTDKIFVIKTLNHIQQGKGDFQQQQVKFVNEALRLAKCSHPHIVKVYEVIEEDGLWGMVMEYINGQDLATYLDEHEKLSEHEALCYINQIGQALEYVHHQGFLHRDIKPSNIILRRGKAEAVLIDFGLAREYSIGQVRNMTNERTDGYAPLEQYKKRGNFGKYTDVYALAATLYTLLTKQVPIPAEYRKNNPLLPPPKQFNPHISNRVNDAILEGMTLDFQKRPQSVHQFRDLLGIVDTPSQIDEKVSAVGMNYTKLQDLLKDGKWQEADVETTRVMLAVVKKENDGCLSEKDIENFPCEDIRTIDKLWLKYSNGHFGFSVQNRMYQDLVNTGTPEALIWDKFGDIVGWKQDKKWMYYDDLTFDLSAPIAHLPGGIFWFDSWWGRYGWFLMDGVEGRFLDLLKRIINCHI